MNRSALINCLFGLLILGPAVNALAANVAPQQPVTAQCIVLEGLAGTWDMQVTGGSAEAFDKSTSLGRITREWVADHKFLHERGGDHEAYLTYEPQKNRYRAWYFHSNGHVWELTGQWTGRTDMLSLSAQLDENQTFARYYQLMGDKSHQCTVSWTDEDGRIGIYGKLSFTRSDPASAKTPEKKPDAIAKLKASPPAEMKIFEYGIGKWAVDGTSTIGDKTTKISGTSAVQWILGGQFMQSKFIVQGGKDESIWIAGFDAATKTYRCWQFDSNGVSSGPATGTWDEKGRTMTWKLELPGDVEMVSKKQWTSRDTAKTHEVYTQADGTVEKTADGTITRVKDK